MNTYIHILRHVDFDFFFFVKKWYRKGGARLCANSRFVMRKGPSTLTQRVGRKSQRRCDSQDVDGPLRVTNREYAHSLAPP